MEKRLIILLLAVVAALPRLYAQSESGMILGLEVEKKINKQLGVSLEADYRSRHDFKTSDRWSVGLNADYKLAKWLKADAGYTYLNTHFGEKITKGHRRQNGVPATGDRVIAFMPLWGLTTKCGAIFACHFVSVGSIPIAPRRV